MMDLDVCANMIAAYMRLKPKAEEHEVIIRTEAEKAEEDDNGSEE